METHPPDVIGQENIVSVRRYKVQVRFQLLLKLFSEIALTGTLQAPAKVSLVNQVSAAKLTKMAASMNVAVVFAMTS